MLIFIMPEFNLFLSIALALLLTRVLCQLVLNRLNMAFVRKHEHAIPESFRATMDMDTYKKAVAYTLAKGRFSAVSTIFDAFVLLFVLFSGLLPRAYECLSGLLGYGVWAQSGILIIIAVVIGLLDLPLELWETFRLEDKFGFNKMTVKLWIADKIKGAIIGLVLALPLLAMLLWVFKSLPDTWWIWGFGLFFSFQLIMMVVYPMWIMPLFNKFEPLPEGELRNALIALGDKTGFRSKTILVMDGSKRSGHSNAFFTGFGRYRRIVLFDTLVEQLTTKELEAVLAHEIGHYKCGHIPKMLIRAAVFGLALFAVLGWLVKQAWFAGSFGFHVAANADGSTMSLVPSLFLFSVLSGLVFFWINPLMNGISRKHEYEADAFAKKALDGDPQPLIGALRKLSKENLSNLTPAPLYSAFYYSHPTLFERENALLTQE